MSEATPKFHELPHDRLLDLMDRALIAAGCALPDGVSIIVVAFEYPEHVQYISGASLRVVVDALCHCLEQTTPVEALTLRDRLNEILLREKS